MAKGLLPGETKEMGFGAATLYEGLAKALRGI